MFVSCYGFHSILFRKLLVLSLKSTWQTLWKASKASLFTTNMNVMWQSTDNGDNLTFMLAWQNTSHLLKQPKEFRNLKKNETIHHSSYLQVFNKAITILARQVLPSGIEPVPAFSLSLVQSQNTFVNLCHITFPKDKRSNFKNYHSGSILNKIL